MSPSQQMTIQLAWPPYFTIREDMESSGRWKGNEYGTAQRRTVEFETFAEHFTDTFFIFGSGVKFSIHSSNESKWSDDMNCVQKVRKRGPVQRIGAIPVHFDPVRSGDPGNVVNCENRVQFHNRTRQS